MWQAKCPTCGYDGHLYFFYNSAAWDLKLHRAQFPNHRGYCKSDTMPQDAKIVIHALNPHKEDK